MSKEAGLKYSWGILNKKMENFEIKILYKKEAELIFSIK